MKRIVVFVVSCFAALSIGAAGAYFTGEAQVPENLVKAGTVAISTEPTSSAISCDTLAPGVTVTKPVTVVNSGDLPVDFVVTAQKKSGITAFYNAITCHVVVDGNVVYDGLLSALKTSPVQLAAGARTQVQFGMSIPSDAGNDLAGGYAKLTLYVDAEQVH